MKFKSEIYTDGGCEPNPGNGGWGFSVMVGAKEIDFKFDGEPDTTNNRMELTAMIEALCWLNENPEHSPALVHSDSQYVVRGCNEWRNGRDKKVSKGKKVPNIDLWNALDAIADDVDCKIQWTKAHVGTLGNERADELAGMGIYKEDDWISDQLRAPE